jgi:hypothetical protein
MIAPFDIFRISDDGHPLWIEAAPDLEIAKARVAVLGALKPGEYLIISLRTGHKMSVKAGTPSNPSRPSVE